MKPDIKADLKARIESAKAYCDSEIARMTEEAERADKNENVRTAARDLRDLYLNFINEGFTEQQAWELIKILVAK